MGSNIIELVKSGHEQAAELKASCGAVDVRSVAQLISDLASQLDVQLARSNALAAENETLKFQEPKLAAMMSCLDAFYADEDVPERAMMAAYNILRKSVGTPVTDVFLAEVRAQGVEMFADKYRAQLTALPTTAENIFDAAHVSLRYQIFDADEFAAQLRQEAAK
ncbi:hypothetical protein ACFW38_002318 [Salmonella enterica]